MALAPTLELPAISRFACEVRAGLLRPEQRTLPCKYLYDPVGSLLFEAICALPEYGLAAADARLLQAHAEAIVALFARPVTVAELGSGSGQKTRYVLEALCRRQQTRYVPIEISAKAIEQCRWQMAGMNGLSVQPLQTEYLAGLAEVARRREAAGGAVLVLFLGSTLGNFERADAIEFLRQVWRRLRPGDGLLLGLDLVKPVSRMELAYNDPAGVTAAFNLNLLTRINRELGGDFDLRGWMHRAVYNAAQQRVEMHLVSCREQTVRVTAAGLTVTFAAGETIFTESSHKYWPRQIDALLHAADWERAGQWVDARWPFAETLCRVAPLAPGAQDG